MCLLPETFPVTIWPPLTNLLGQMASISSLWHYRGTSLKRNSPPTVDHHIILGIVLLYGPRSVFVFMSTPVTFAESLHHS